MDGRAPDDGEAGGRFKAPADDAGPFPAARRRRILFTMPELPEIVTYLDAFRGRIVGEPLEAVRLRSPSLLRTFQPPLSDRALSRLLGEDWPRTLEELEDHLAARKGPGREP